MIKKLNLLFVPFLIISASCLVIFTAIDWIYNSNPGLFPIDDIFFTFIPFILPIIPALIWLYPGIKKIEFKKRRGGDPVFGYFLIAIIVMAIPGFVIHSYLETATGKMTNLGAVKEIDSKEKTKYYTLKSGYYDKGHASIYLKGEVTGKHNENMNFHVYFAIPILDSIADTISNHCPVWLGYEYKKTVKNELSDEEYSRQFEAFEMHCIDDMNTKALNNFEYLKRMVNNEEHTGYIKAIKQQKKYTVEADIPVLKPVMEPFDQRNGSSLDWIFGAYGLGAVAWMLFIAFPKLKNETEIAVEVSAEAKEKSGIKDLVSFFVPATGHYATTVIIDINIIVFVIMVISGLGFLSFETKDLLAWGANYRPYTEGGGQWWRLVTSTFLHGGLMHILMNMYGLLFIGIFLEPLLGRTKFALIYLVTGIIASLASLYMHAPVVSVGASGAIFGMYGVFFAFLLAKVYPMEFKKAFLSSTLLFIGYNLVIGFAYKGIDNSAHIGGLLSGFLIGLIIAGPIKNNQENPGTTRKEI
jgi:rhomboid protease GluP